MVSCDLFDSAEVSYVNKLVVTAMAAPLTLRLTQPIFLRLADSPDRDAGGQLLHPDRNGEAPRRIGLVPRLVIEAARGHLDAILPQHRRRAGERGEAVLPPAHRNFPVHCPVATGHLCYNTIDLDLSTLVTPVR